MSAPQPGGRLRAYLAFSGRGHLLLSGALARPPRSHPGLSSEQWFPLVEQAILVVPAAAGLCRARLLAQPANVSHQRHRVCRAAPGWPGEAALGLATGWGVAVVCVLLAGSRRRHRHLHLRRTPLPGAGSWSMRRSFALAALAEEIAFRGYGFQRFVVAVGPVGRLAWICRLLRHHPVPAAGVQPRQRHGLRGPRPGALRRLPAHPRPLGELGHQLRLEGQPRPALRTRHQRRQQPLPRRPGRPDGPVLAHRRRLRPRRKLGCLPPPPRRHSRRLPHHPRSRLPLQRPGDCARRHSRRSRCRRPRPA